MFKFDGICQGFKDMFKYLKVKLGLKNNKKGLLLGGFQVVTKEILEKMSLRFYANGKELKEGDLIIAGFTIGCSNLDGRSYSTFSKHDDASGLNMVMFVLNDNILFQLYNLENK